MQRSSAPLAATVKIKIPKGSKAVVRVPALVGRNFIPSSAGEMSRKALVSAKSDAIKKKLGL